MQMQVLKGNVCFVDGKGNPVPDTVLSATERSQLDEVRQLSRPFHDDYRTVETDSSEIDSDPFEDVSDFFPEYD
jgi:hypothetical protein